MKIFLSRPTLIPQKFERGLKRFEQHIKRRGFTLKTVGTNHAVLRSPLDGVIDLMKECDGLIVLGYPQIEITSGKFKPDTSEENPVENHSLATEWNHIETGIAYTLKKPVLIIHHNGISRGVFDIGVVNNMLYSADLSDPNWINFSQFNEPLKTFLCNVSKLKLRNQWKYYREEKCWDWTVFLEDNACHDLERVAYVEYKLDESYEEYKSDKYTVKVEDRSCTVQKNVKGVGNNPKWGFSFTEEAYETFTIKAKIYLSDGTIWRTEHTLDFRKRPIKGISV